MSAMSQRRLVRHLPTAWRRDWHRKLRSRLLQPTSLECSTSGVGGLEIEIERLALHLSFWGRNRTV
jgi:hypothetical protein